MKLSMPDADEVFNNWLKRADSNKVDRNFGVKKEAITAAENVKEVEKSAFLYFSSEILAKKKDLKGKQSQYEEVSVSKIKGLNFYSFPANEVDANNWKGKESVYMLTNLKEINCKKCNGKGTEKCNRCNNSRFISCEDCNSKGNLNCEKCGGSGRIIIELKVKEISKKGDEKKKIEKRTHLCPQCYGEKKITCVKCGGSGKIVCYECKGKQVACRECNGVGIFYEIKEDLVPLTVPPRKETYSFVAKKDEWMMKDKEYNKKLESVEAYSIKDIQQIDENDLKDLFGVIALDKDLKSCIEDTKKAWENLEKDFNKGKSSERPLKPISLVFLLRLAIETQKKKKFELYALGTKERYSIMTNNF